LISVAPCFSAGFKFHLHEGNFSGFSNLKNFKNPEKLLGSNSSPLPRAKARGYSKDFGK
jgi:hypothetical protein